MAAIAPDGKVLWCSEIVPIAGKEKHAITLRGIVDIRLMKTTDWAPGGGKGKEYLRVNIFGEGFGGMSGYIDKKTGKLTGGEVS